MDVARQTISKWELGETSPDLEQAKQLSKIFNVSLDDLTNNDIKNILITKTSHTEKMIKTIMDILKIILLIVIIIVIVLVADLYFRKYFTVTPKDTMQSVECELNGKKYSYEIWQTNETSNILDKIVTEDANLHVDVKDYTNFEEVKKAIKEDVISRGGNCDSI